MRILGGIVFCMLCVSCVYTPENSSYYDTLYKQELAYCNQLLSVYFLFQESLPEDYSSFASCESLFADCNEPHTVYYNKTSPVSGVISTLTRQSGTGIALDTMHGAYIVVDVVPGSPGAVAGIHILDTVHAINDSSVSSYTFKEITDVFAGKKGTVVIVGITRQTGQDTAKVICATYKDRSVHMSWLDTALVYIELKVFASQTCISGGSAEELAVALDSSRAAAHTILDLRGTHGGDFDQCRTVCGYFAPAGARLIDMRERVYDAVLMTGRTRDTSWTTSVSGPAIKRACYVLVDSLTSQAAEVLVASLHDTRPDIVSVGTRTGGNGRAQGYYETPDSGMAVITNTLFSPVTNPPFDGSGISPDRIILPGSDALEVARSLIN